TEAWATAQPHLMRAASTVSSSPSSFPASPLTGVPSLSTRAVTRWDEHLNLAKREHHRKNWGQVRQLCTGVISIADDWTAVEQAHLRLALAEQKDGRVDAARRAFQEGTEACPSSDTLFMAWALMESKIHNARSRKAARALLRRAVALNPKRHSDVLKWRVFLDWKEVGEAAVEAVRSALSSGEATTVIPATAGVGAAGAAAAAAASADSRRSRVRAEEKERGLATDLLALCKTVGDDYTAEHEASTALGMCKVTREKVMAKHEVRFEELAGELEKTGKGLAGGVGGAGGGEQRELSGSWRLVFTTCTTCDRILLRAGSDFYQRLTPPITEIARRPGDSSAPFQCEVLLRPFCWSKKHTQKEEEDCNSPTPPSPAGSLPKSGKKACVAYFLRGWAHAPAHKRDSGERMMLRQQVAPRSAVVVRRDSSSAGSGVGHTRVPSATPPQSLFSALGQVARGGKGLEKVATQEVTYVGEQLRIGRTAEGEV
ncbi:unnamed protein product, partial [Laminaria digitata]